MGYADAAVTAFQELGLLLGNGVRRGLQRARALSGLTAALVAAGRVDEAVASARRSIVALQQANLLRSRCDIYAWVAAAASNPKVASQLIGAGDDFARRRETARDPISQHAQEQALALIRHTLIEGEIDYWREQGVSMSDSELVHLIDHLGSG